MKKLISVLLAVFMLTSLSAPAIYASGDTIYYQPNSIGVVGGVDAVNVAGAVAGSADATGIKKYTPRNNPEKPTYHAGFIYNNSGAFTATRSANYVVFESDFIASELINISVCRSGSGDATAKLTSGWIEGQWNTIRIVYENPTTSYSKGRAVFYLNGETVLSYTENSYAFDNQYRMSFLFNNNSGSLYVKNYRMYGADSDPGAIAMPQISGVSYNGTVQLDYNTLVNSLTSDGCTVRVYSSDFITMRAPTDMVLDNDKIIVENTNGIISTFTADVEEAPQIIVDPDIKYAPNSTGVVGGSDAQSATEAVYGAQSATGIKKYLPRDHAEDKPYYAGYIWNDASVLNVVKTGKYIVFETDFAGFDIQNVSLYKNGQGEVSPKLTSGWKEGQWNTLRIVYESPTTEYSNGRTAYYINGIQKMDFTENTGTFDNQIRFHFMFNDAEGELYVKNYRMWATNDSAPSAIIMPVHPDASENGYIVFLPETDANTILVTGCQVRVYSSNFSQLRATTDKIQQNDMIVVENLDGIITTYVAMVDYTSIIDDKSGVLFDNGGGSIQTGVCGKSVDNESLSISGNASFVTEYTNPANYNYHVAKVSFVPSSELESVSLCSPTSDDSIISITDNWYYDEWNTALFVYDKAESKVRAYLNGELENEKNVTVSGDKIGIVFNTTGSSTPLYIDDFILRIQRTEPVVSSTSSIPETTYAPSSITTIGGISATPSTKTVYGQRSVGSTHKFVPRNADLTQDPTKTHYYAGILWQGSSFTKGDNNYIVFETDFAPKDLLKIGLFSSGTSQVSPLVTSGWNEGEWNNLRIVHECSTVGNYTKGRTAFYINGKEVKEYSNNENTLSDGDFRLLFQFENAKGELYVNNYRMYYSSEAVEAPSQPRLSFCKDGKAFVDLNTTVQSISSDKFNIRVYNSDFSVMRNSNDFISQNDKIIVEDKDSGAFATYTAQVNYISFINDTTGSVFGTETFVSSKCGKDSNDKSLEVSGNPSAISQISEYNGYTYYLVGVNFIPNSDLSSVKLCSENVMNQVENGWRADVWNNITFVYDSVGGSVSSYLNGTLLGTAPATASMTSNKLGIDFDSGNSQSKLYIDDYTIELYRTEPVIEVVAVPPVGTILGGNLMTSDTAKVSDLKVQGAKLTVFEDNTYCDVMDETEFLFGNNMAVYVNDRNMYFYYNILNNNLKIWGETALNATYNYDTEIITVSGQLKHVGNLQMILTYNGSVAYTETISSNETGGVSFTVQLGEEFLNKNYLCTLTYGDYTKQIEITTVKSIDLSVAVGNINSAATATALAAILPTEALNLGLEDGTTKDNSYMANMIFAMKPKGGFDNNTFVDAYETAEGLAKLDLGSITLTNFLTNYANNIGSEFLVEYNLMNNEQKSDLAMLFTNQLDPKPTFRDLFDSAKWFTSYRTAVSAVVTKLLFMQYATDNNISMTNYNRIGNDYYQDKVFEKMFDVRASITTQATLESSFNTAVTTVINELNKNQQQQSPQGGGGGGGGGGGRAPSHVVTPVEPQPKPDVQLQGFRDVSEHWAKVYIEKLSDSGIINGFEDGTFRPDSSITRAEFSKIIAGILNISASGTNEFIDVPQSSWFFDCVTALSQHGIINGYDKKFMPERNISRQDMAVIICRALELSGKEAITEAKVEYADAHDVSDYAKEAVAQLTNLGMLTGSEGCFNPLNTATRAEAVAIFSRLIDYLG